MDDDSIAAEWDAEALVFDDEPHHALTEASMRAAWAEVLRDALPTAPSTVADLGCGTGSVSVLLAEQGYAVHGIDVSPEMVARARAKASAYGVEASFDVGDAGDPRIAPVDVVLTRHVAWAVPDLDAAVGRWVSCLRPGGRLVLVEGLWSNGAGLASDGAGRRRAPPSAVGVRARARRPRAVGVRAHGLALPARGPGRRMIEVERLRTASSTARAWARLRALLDAAFGGGSTTTTGRTPSAARTCSCATTASSSRTPRSCRARSTSTACRSAPATSRPSRRRPSSRAAGSAPRS